MFIDANIIGSEKGNNLYHFNMGMIAVFMLISIGYENTEEKSQEQGRPVFEKITIRIAGETQKQFSALVQLELV